MAEQQPTSPVHPPQTGQQLIVTRALDFKARYSNYFRMRVGPGECTVTFCTITDVPAPQAPAGFPQIINMVQEDFSLTVTWPVLKALTEQLGEVLRAVEEEVGKQRSFRTILTSEQAVESYRQNIRANLKE